MIDRGREERKEREREEGKERKINMLTENTKSAERTKSAKIL